MFSIFDMVAIDDEEPEKEPIPFLNVETVVVDESDFHTDKHRRYLKTSVHTLRQSSGH